MKRFARCHPSVNFLYYISTVVFGVMFLHPVLLCISFCSAFAYAVKLSGKKAVRSFFCFLLPLVIVVTLINALTAHYGVTQLFALPDGNFVCLEPILYGFVTGTAAAAVLLLFSCYQQTVTSDKLFYVLGKKLPKTALLLTMSLRFVPLYRQKLHEISAAQKGLLSGNEEMTLRDKLRSGGRNLSVFLTWALENSVETADSMKCRGYGLPNRSHYADYHFSAFDGFLAALMLICDAVILTGAFTGVTDVLYNPFFQIEKITVFTVVIFCCYALLFCLPLMLDITEDCKWKRCKSKI